MKAERWMASQARPPCSSFLQQIPLVLTGPSSLFRSLSVTDAELDPGFRLNDEDALLAKLG